MTRILIAHLYPKQLRRKILLLNYTAYVKVSLSPLLYLVNNDDKKWMKNFSPKKAQRFHPSRKLSTKMKIETHNQFLDSFLICHESNNTEEELLILRLS